MTSDSSFVSTSARFIDNDGGCALRVTTSSFSFLIDVNIYQSRNNNNYYYCVCIYILFSSFSYWTVVMWEHHFSPMACILAFLSHEVLPCLLGIMCRR